MQSVRPLSHATKSARIKRFRLRHAKRTEPTKPPARTATIDSNDGIRTGSDHWPQSPPITVTGKILAVPKDVRAPPLCSPIPGIRSRPLPFLGIRFASSPTPDVVAVDVEGQKMTAVDSDHASPTLQFTPAGRLRADLWPNWRDLRIAGRGLDRKDWMRAARARADAGVSWPFLHPQGGRRAHRLPPRC